MLSVSLSDISMEMMSVGLLIMLVTTTLGYTYYSGFWSSIKVSTSETEYGPLTLAYKTSVGPYKNAGEFFTESFCLLPGREQLGIYYDDPEGMQADQLRCAVGPVLAKGTEKPVPEEMEKMIKNGFKIAHFPKPSYVVMASFPFTTTLSIFLAIYKVYPRLKDYIAQRNLCAYPAMEVYTDSSIIFMMPLSRQDEFFVPEFQEEEMSIATTDMGSFSGMESPMQREGEEMSIANTDMESFNAMVSPLLRDNAGFVIPRSPVEDMRGVDELRGLRESDVSSVEESEEEQDEVEIEDEGKERKEEVVEA